MHILRVAPRKTCTSSQHRVRDRPQTSRIGAIPALERKLLMRASMSTATASMVFSILPLALALAYALAGLFQ